MEPNANTIAHLQMVQGVIARLAGNSARAKTWAVTIVAGILAFAGAVPDPHWIIAVAAAVPVVAFWTLDARYLRLERCYVRLHAAVAAGEPVAPFSLDFRPYEKDVADLWDTSWSWSVWCFYLPLAVVTVSVLLVLGV